MPASSRADHLLPAGEDHLHEWPGSAAHRAGQQPRHRLADRAGAPRGGRRRSSGAGLRPGSDPGHDDALGQRCRRGQDGLARRAAPPRGRGSAPGRARRTRHRGAASAPGRFWPGRARAHRGAAPGRGSAAPLGRRGSVPRARRSRTRSSRWGPTVLTPRRRSSPRLAAERAQQVALPAPAYCWRTRPDRARRPAGHTTDPTGCVRSATSRSRAATRTLPASASR